MLTKLTAVLGAALALAHVQPAAAAEAVTPQTVTRFYADMAETAYGDAAATAKNLDAAVANLLKSPTPETLAAARNAWKVARVPYLKTEGFRFGNKVVDDWEGRVNSWPLDEGLIDYVDAKTYGETKDDNPLYSANVIANKALQIGPDKVDATTIDKDLLRKLHQALEVEANVATGYHAIEFLLWGQDLNGTGPGAGNRPATDFDLAKCTGGNCDRRRAYLTAATGLLVDDLDEMTANWKAGGAARKELEDKGPEGGLVSILTGLGSLSFGEMAGERIKLGVLLHDPEEEQDCFSDNTHNAHVSDELGIIGIWNGRYTTSEGKVVSGPSIADLTRAANADAAKRVDAALSATLSKLQAIKIKAESGVMAYDQMLAPGNEEGSKMLLDAADALVAQTRAIEGAVTVLNLKIEVAESKGLAKLEKEKK